MRDILIKEVPQIVLIGKIMTIKIERTNHKAWTWNGKGSYLLATQTNFRVSRRRVVRRLIDFIVIIFQFYRRVVEMAYTAHLKCVPGCGLRVQVPPRRLFIPLV